MKRFLQSGVAFAASACVTLVCLLLMASFMTTALFMEVAIEGSAQEQQRRIDVQADDLARQWHITPQVLTDCTAQAARTHRKTVAQWWSGLFTGESDAMLPAFLTAETERSLVADIMADASFSAHVDADMKRAVARDEVAYALDEAVCAAVLPLRRSVMDLALSIAADRIPLPMVRPVLLTAAGVLTMIAAGLCVCLRRDAGTVMLATAVWMLLLSLAVWTMDIPGMLRPLNPAAALQGTRALQLLAVLWYGTAAMMTAAGLLVVSRKEAQHA